MLVGRIARGLSTPLLITLNRAQICHLDHNRMERSSEARGVGVLASREGKASATRVAST